mgnify:CR=1 FL=1
MKRNYLYPVSVAFFLVIVSVSLYIFFNIWPMIFSLYIAFTDANENNIVPSPRLIQLLEERKNLTETLYARKDEILGHLNKIDASASSIKQYISDYMRDLESGNITPQSLNSYISKISSEMLNLNSLISARGYYLSYYPELRSNASQANDLVSQFATEISAVIFFKASLSREDIDKISNISMKYLPDVENRINNILAITRSMESNYDLFVAGVLRDIDKEIDRLTLHFVGVDNFRRLFTEAPYPYAIYKTILFVLTSVPLKMIVGVGIAFIFSSPLVIGKRVFRTLLILPWALPVLLTVTTWRILFLPGQGPFAQFFSSFLGREFNIYNLEWDAFTVYNIVETWLAYPFVMTVTLGAISGIPREIIEASYIDGAGIISRFVRVTLPLTLRPIAFAAIMTTGASLQAFLVPLLVNNGGPATIISFPGTRPELGYANDFILLYGYRLAYFYREYGLSAASYIVAVLILLIYAIMWYYFLYRKR